MSANTINAGKVLLRTHREADKRDYAALPQEAEFYRQLGGSVPAQLTREQEAEAWFQKKTDPLHSWAIEVESRCVGSVWLHSIDTLNRSARFAIEIFNPRYRGLGIGTISTSAIVKFAFTELRLHRLDLRVLTMNKHAIQCYERCGFKKEGVMRDTLYLDGEWHSDLWMSILESDYAMVSKAPQ
jgi:ribosomal-protein-alanine N-acetyltransferase